MSATSGEQWESTAPLPPVVAQAYPQTPAPVPVTVMTTDVIAARILQAMTGCTIHPHGPLNAIAALIEGHAAGTLDGHVACASIAARCVRQIDALPPGLDRMREQKVLAVITVIERGLRP